MPRRKAELLDAGFERRGLHIEKSRGSVRPANPPIALLDGLPDDRQLGLVERAGRRLYGNRSQRRVAELEYSLGP